MPFETVLHRHKKHSDFALLTLYSGSTACVTGLSDKEEYRCLVRYFGEDKRNEMNNCLQIIETEMKPL